MYSAYHINMNNIKKETSAETKISIAGLLVGMTASNLKIVARHRANKHTASKKNNLERLNKAKSLLHGVKAAQLSNAQLDRISYLGAKADNLIDAIMK